MTSYNIYKAELLPLVADVPEHWQINRIKNLCEINREVLNASTPFDYLLDYVDIGNTNDKGDFTNVQKIEFAEAPSRARRKVKNGDTILSTVRTYLRAIAYIVNPSENLIVSTGFAVLSPYENRLKSKYLYYQITADSFVQQVIANSEGVSYPSISSSKLAGLKIVVPTLDEQLVIASYLDEQTQKIDKLIANKKAQLDKLKELRQIEINNAVTKGLNPDVELEDSGIDWLGQIPKHWTVNRLKNTTFINQNVIPESTSPEYEIRYIDIGNVSSTGNFIELQDMIFADAPSRARRKPKHNSIILSTVRTYLRAIAFVEFPEENLIASTGFAVIDANEHILFSKYLFFQMISHVFVERVIAISEGVSYPAISSTNLENIKVVIPPKDEQEKIAKYLTDKTKAIDKLITNIETQIEKLQELRKIKIYEAVTGKIKINAYVETTA